MKNTSSGSSSWVLRFVAVFLPLIAVIDTVLPFLFRGLAKYCINRTPGTRVKMKAFRISFFRKAVFIRGLELHYGSLNAQEYNISLAAEEIKIGFEWLKLFKGQLVTGIVIKTPDAAIMHTHAPANYAGISTGHTSDTACLPVLLTQLAVENGTVGYTDFTTTPNSTVKATALNVVINNLTGELVYEAIYKMNINANVCDGSLRMDAIIRMQQQWPDFDLNIALQELSLPLLNSFMLAYARVDVSEGSLDLFAEAKAGSGKFNGYIKPLLTDIDFTSPDEMNRGVVQALLETVSGVVLELIENQRHDQVATEIPFTGTFDDPKIKVGKAILLVFVNAFVKALSPTFNYRFDKEVIKAD